MQKMTSYERFKNTLERNPVDRIPFAVTPWPETIKLWVQQGYLCQDEDASEHFDQDFYCDGVLNSVADMDFKEQVIEELDQTITVLDGNGAKLRRHKLHTATPEHVDFTVKDREQWEKRIKSHLLNVDKRRIPYESYRTQKAKAAAQKKFFAWIGLGPFEQIHPMCGHEYALMGMALDPDWVKDMVMTYVNMTLMHLEELFAQEGRPDGMLFIEDLGFKNKPFMSPQMYKEIIQPGHKKLFDYAHSIGCRVMVHSCGFVEPLVPDLIEAGMDCLQAMEVKAGMDLPHLFELFGGKIAFFGGIDVRVLISNDCQQIDEELTKKIVPVMQKGGSYILHSDHSEPPEVKYETMRYFIKRGIEIAKNGR